MPGSGTEEPRSLSSRAEALLRSLVGVTAGEVRLDASGTIETVRVVSDGRQSSGQVVQNVRSALLAGLGVRLKVAQVELVAALAAPVGDVAPETPSPIPDNPAPAPVAKNGNGNGHGTNGNGHASHGNGHAANGNGHAAKGNGHAGNGNGRDGTQQPRPARQLPPRMIPVAANALDAEVESGAMQKKTAAKKAGAFSVGEFFDGLVDVVTDVSLEKVELIRQTGRLRCRVVLAVGSDRFSAVADAAEDTVAEIQLAGRVATDALRAGSLTTAQFEGATIAYIAGRVHVVVALTDLRNGVPAQLTGSAVVHQTLEEAAAQAVLQALPIRRI